MRFRTLYVIGFAVLIVLQMLLITRLPLAGSLGVSVILAVLAIIMLLLLLLEYEFRGAHAFVVAILILSVLYLPLYHLTEPTISTVFLGVLFIILYLFTIGLVMIYDWKQYRAFDKMIEAMREKKGTQTTLDKYEESGKGISAEELLERPTPPKEYVVDVQEPPRVRVREDEDGEWIEIKALKKPKAAKKKTAKKKAVKKAAKKQATKKVKKTAQRRPAKRARR